MTHKVNPDGKVVIGSPKTQMMYLCNPDMYVEYNYDTQKLTIYRNDKPILTINTKNLK